VIDVAYENFARLSLLLEMAFQTKGLVPCIEHALVNRAVRRMTNHATLSQRFVFIDKRTTLDGMTLEAGLVLAEKGHASAFE